MATVYRLYRQMRAFRPHVVHTHLAKAGAVGRLAARLARVPVVVHTFHGHVFHGYFSPRKTRMILEIERRLARWTDRIVVLGEAQEREILEYGVGRPDQMARIPLGLELEPFLNTAALRGRLRKELGVAAGTPLVGIVARLVPIKAHDLFLAVAARVHQRVPTARFVIVGDGELRESLERQAARAKLPVDFLGMRGDLPAIYADLDVVVLCSRNEGLPVTIIEGLAAARPVAATDVGAVRDLVIPGETGWLTPSGDVDALAESVLAALREPSRAAACGRAGRARVYPALSIERLERDLTALYEETLATKMAYLERHGARTVATPPRRADT
jgi:glycosyltransferase involved in cell wall biosynthesis